MRVNLLEKIILKAAPVMIFPKEFLIAWCGVPVLVYKGFPKSILNIKSEIDKNIQGLTLENPGSKWPKTTLGCLKDGETLNYKEIANLKDICEVINSEIDTEEGYTIQELNVVLIQDRTAEKRLSTFKIPLNLEKELDMSFDSEAVEKVVQDFSYENLSAYSEKIKMKGHRQGHYQKPFICSTLIYDLPENQPDYFTKFTNAIDEAFPEKFIWFHPSSRHITIRALIGIQGSK